MHILQERILKLSEGHDLAKMSLRQIGKLINEPAPQKIKHHIMQLEKNGLLQMDRLAKVMVKTKPGSLYQSPLVAIAILGTANCGPATVYAEENVEGYLRISGRLLTKKKGIFAIKASGYSMNKANINGECIEDGDYVIVDPTYKNFRNGDYVLSIIDGMANIKRYFDDKTGKRIILLSESSASFSPIFIHYDDMDSYLANGKVIQVIKKPKSKLSKFKKFIYRAS